MNDLASDYGRDEEWNIRRKQQTPLSNGLQVEAAKCAMFEELAQLLSSCRSFIDHHSRSNCSEELLDEVLQKIDDHLTRASILQRGELP